MHKRSVFETRIDVLEAVRSLGDEAISSRIASSAKINQRTLQVHLAFLQVKDLVTVADHTVEERHKLRKRSKSSVFRITPEGRRILATVLPIREHLTSDKRRDWTEALKDGERNTDALLTA
jgi:predicted transcriptional regulator